MHITRKHDIVCTIYTLYSTQIIYYDRVIHNDNFPYLFPFNDNKKVYVFNNCFSSPKKLKYKCT